jgi:hypothetical protein
MEGAFDREATAIVRKTADRMGITAPADGIDHYAFLDATGDSRTAPDTTDPWLDAMNGYPRAVTSPYAGFLAEVGGPDSGELHEMILTATLSGDLGPLQSWLDGWYGPGEFVALFRSGAYAPAAT